jgi:predicted membrane-bound spermidine synthase
MGGLSHFIFAFAILTNMSRLAQRLLFCTVFITGAAVLIVEVGAMRLLAPYYGSSLTVVSSVLSIILLALSLGYYVGGRLADRYPLPLLLATIIGTAGILLLGLLYITLTALPTIAPQLGQSAGPLALAFLTFFIPAFLLGIDSPFVSKLLASNTNDEGRVVGTVFFWSTIGSILGSFLAGFYLIPTFGLTPTLTYTALVLILWSCLLVLSLGTEFSPRTRFTIIGVFVVSAVIGTSILLTTSPYSRGTLIHAKDGLYSQMTVYDEEIRGTTYRFLKNDTNFSSAIIPGSLEVVFPYAEVALMYTDMVPDAASYLVLGGGAYTIPRHVHSDNPNITIDTIELEPYLLPIAHTYFELPIAPELRNYNEDARVFLQSTTTTYDVVFSDVMNSGHYTPPHHLTAEFFATLKERLSPEGVIFLNYIGSLDTTGRSMTGSVVRTIATVFPNYQLLPMHSTTEKRLQNIIVVLRHDDMPIAFMPDTRIQNRLYGYDFDVNSRLLTLDENTLADEIVFTDERPGQEPLQAKQFRLHNQ